MSTTDRMRPRTPFLGLAFTLLLAATLLAGAAFAGQARAASAVLLGWNNLGMHCMDSDYSVFSILPPYNTLEAQLIVNGKLVTDGSGYTVTYEAMRDPAGSINTTSAGKTDFYDFAALLYGASLAADQGLKTWAMPGAGNVPQRMLFESSDTPAPGVSTVVNWFHAEGIPITPVDDAGNRNMYPLMKLVARNSSGQVVAQSPVVLPVSDEMDCSACHGTPGDYRRAVLQSHDAHESARDAAGYKAALTASGYLAEGLLATADAGTPVLCARCHQSEALGTKSYGDIPPLTASMHSFHASVSDPATGKALGDSTNRASCYRCHPGSTTRCLRGAMGSAVAADGTMSMQCQACHGGMSQVGSPTRVGWFQEPDCQSCHTGTATRNNGQIRYTSVFDGSGKVRVAVDGTFATNPDTPAAGISLYRFSRGHGGLQCSACHGSTHAEFPAADPNDNLRNEQIQGHAGVVAECTACHPSMPVTDNGGPHGMHPVGQDWVDEHKHGVDALGRAACQACHGTDDRGTVLSRVQGARSFSVEGLGTQTFYRGATVGCYTCHQGPSSDTWNTTPPPAISDVSAATTAGSPVRMTLPSGNPSAVPRVLSQPANGTVGVNGGIATYHPAEGFVGTDTFTFASYDGAKNSAPATATVRVANAVKVTAPAGGTIYRSSTQSIAFGIAAPVSGGSFGIALRDAASGALTSIATTATVAGRTDYALPWKVTQAAGSYRLVVTLYAADGTTPVATGESADITLAAAPKATVTGPPAGSCARGSQQTVSWTLPAGGVPSGSFAVWLKNAATGAMTRVTPAASLIPAVPGQSEYSAPWTASQADATYYVCVYYYDVDGVTVLSSNACAWSVAILPYQTPSAITPESATLPRGSVQRVTWTAPAGFTSGFFRLYLKNAATNVLTQVTPTASPVTVVPGQTSYETTWSVTQAAASYRLQVSYYAAGTTVAQSSGLSAGAITVTPAPQPALTGPAAGGVLKGSPQTVTWTVPAPGAASGSYGLWLKNAATSALTRVTPATALIPAALGQSFYGAAWSATQAVGSYYLLVYYYAADGVTVLTTAQSAGAYTVSLPQITSPAAGASVTRGSSQTVTWTVPGGSASAGSFRLFLKNAAGATYVVTTAANAVKAVAGQTTYSAPWSVTQAAGGYTLWVYYYAANGTTLLCSAAGPAVTVR